ncbi:hypothetical protein M3484_11770 [Pseudomonas sp. GX19020]|uniref:hypothetical protein n=1 Tax=Pseudomonas sp. GX19020 TaxID=2942277 RepID=UPI002018FF45|nr:hypothetical protein [Pseudomonas sp. GX19020]MCL4067250.1 hypothetical protein [Pseudomonas sp. GX19020]
MSALIIRPIVIAAIFGMLFLIGKIRRDLHRAKRLADGTIQLRFFSRNGAAAVRAAGLESCANMPGSRFCFCRWCIRTKDSP